MSNIEAMLIHQQKQQDSLQIQQRLYQEQQERQTKHQKRAEQNYKEVTTMLKLQFQKFLPQPEQSKRSWDQDEDIQTGSSPLAFLTSKRAAVESNGMNHEYEHALSFPVDDDDPDINQ